MTVESFDQLLKGLLERRPFQIFTVVLHGDERFEVDSPLAVATRDGFAVYTGPAGTLHFFDSDSTIQFLVPKYEALPES